MILTAKNSIRANGKDYKKGDEIKCDEKLARELLSKNAAEGKFIVNEKKDGEDDPDSENDRRISKESNTESDVGSKADDDTDSGNASQGDKEPVESTDDLTRIKGIGGELALSLKERLNINSFKDLAEADFNSISIIPGLGEKKSKKIIEDAKSLI